MKISYLSCDICGFKGKNPTEHQHKELEIGGVPMNIWTLVYSLPKSLKLNDYCKGIARYKEYIPFEIRENVVDEECNTPMIKLKENIFLKDESQNPTHSFKDRGIVMLVSDALKAGKKKIAIPSTGNAAISLGYYANKAGLESIVFIPEDTALSKKEQIKKRSTIIYDKDLVKSYEHFFDFCRTDDSVYNGFPVTNLPYAQGIKTISYEIFLQMGDVPEWIIIPVGSGGNVVAQYNGFKDLINMGLTDKIPRFATVQIKGADPITLGYQTKQYDDIILIEDSIKSKAEAIASDTCFNYFKIMSILNETRGIAISVTDKDIEENQHARWLEFSSQSIFPALDMLINNTNKKDTIVLVGTAIDRG
ncbi:hypothetical protein COY26_02635 [Candidatus Woesearchaeota archaeon CG_4_10_14_0_2_um_filter_33_10]|nr:MAG: hypothetical protein AUJ83_00345 [Candidatus Woesearchaeota archaeon CG1_02_33_12]PIN78532.1 MAG: hypothetical protein COV14_03225 [Candidatus Woesearchaeota archaeon CG10_big_fil_rev_8_21_14_0_10_33_12]PIU73079.1 MAG: hypothetical protein COS79_00195 [Candidatus Woesearchaeota archaeon CG06_land_8_20_14_3_00_33_13]PIZ53198.1 MAG: hypothetical protein COY26_02635 [Candidatus Woesearchaeota archaeon CG_4_10_14_0_2_um_filter_33_10]